MGNNIDEQSQNSMSLLSRQAGVAAGYTPAVSCVGALPLVQRWHASLQRQPVSEPLFADVLPLQL
jgi:hypothetical protein